MVRCNLRGVIPTARQRPIKPLRITYRIVSIGGDNTFAILTEGEPMTLRHERSQDIISLETAEVEDFLRRGVWRLEARLRRVYT